MTTQIKLRRDTAANWTSNDPVLGLGEMGIETDTRQFKFGDGSTAWTALSYGVAPDASALTAATSFSGDISGFYNAIVVEAASGAFALEGDATITDTGTVDNYALGASVAVLRWNGASGLTLTGMAGGADGRLLFIANVTAAQTLTLKHQDGGSSASNQFFGAGAADVAVAAGTGVLVVYDTTSSRWRVLVSNHARSHDHSNALDGSSVSPATLVIPSATGPAQTAEGSAVWDSDDDVLTIGTGAGRKTLSNSDHAHAGTQFTIGGVVLDPSGARTVEVWRAPFSCTVTGYRARVVGGTNAVTNAQVDSTDLLTGDLTTTPADGWEAGTVKSDGTENITAGEVLKLEVVSISGAVTEVSWTLTLTRAVP